MEGNAAATGLQEKFSSLEPGGCSERKCQDRLHRQYFMAAAHASEHEERAKARGTSVSARLHPAAPPSTPPERCVYR